ncbi:hypothetical protein VP01_478g7 [Puccinia sorghi]|uniref:Uncharacterized protein n=1 Tax=Puccinia sorghi TaxID=27349 RepID=A0A0L6UMP0_9BASI|nr:hypothetical protein VP01_478g7 [Puccinia sorghi]
MQWDVTKELAHMNKNLKQAKDRNGLIPKLDKQKDYIEAYLSGVSTIGATKSAEVKKEDSKAVENESTGKITQLQRRDQQIIQK